VKPDLWTRAENFFGTDKAGIIAWTQSGLFLAWILFFGLESLLIFRDVSRLVAAEEGLASLASDLSQQSGELVAATNQMRAISKDFNLFRGILNILPQDPGYLRTQRVISEEVETLRRKLSHRLLGKLYIVVDTKANKLYVKHGMTLLWQADCSVGRGGRLFDKKTGQRWEFVTPRGEFHVLGKIENPVWIKPDWAFVESKEPIPPPDDPSRKIEGELGKYVLNLGDGYLIHGTKDEKVLGRSVSHGCVRLGAQNLEKLYQTVPVGTRVYIY
jgi:L,D-transpeptidase YbiS